MGFIPTGSPFSYDTGSTPIPHRFKVWRDSATRAHHLASAGKKPYAIQWGC